MLIETLEFEFVLFIPSDLYATWVDRECVKRNTHGEAIKVPVIIIILRLEVYFLMYIAKLHIIR